MGSIPTPGTDDEESQVIRYLMNFDTILEEIEEWPDGFSVMIRKANYLDTRSRGHLSLVKG